MDIDEIKRNLRGYIVQRFAVPSDDAEFTEDVHLFDYGYVDSFGAVELVEFVQDRFGVVVSPSDLMVYPMNTINDIATFVSLRKRGEL
jgi:D-alanine--poly(phosphoribitol) ligase subunit 2